MIPTLRRHEHDGGPKPPWLADLDIVQAIAPARQGGIHSRLRTAGSLGDFWRKVTYFWTYTPVPGAEPAAPACPHNRSVDVRCDDCEWEELQEMARELRW